MKTTLLILSCGLMSQLLYGQNTCIEALPIIPDIYTVPAIEGEEIPEPICAQNGGGASGGMWYTYTPTDTVVATITTLLPQNAGVDNRMHVYTGECGALECVAGNDDAGGTLQCAVTWTALANISYFIAFDDKWEPSGFDFKFTAEAVENPGQVYFGFDTQTMTNFPRSLAIVDMTGDYLDDLVDVTNVTVSMRVQNEDTGFDQITVTTPPAQFAYVWSIAAGDIDGNGHNDLVYGGSSGVSFMYRNDNGIGFTHWATSDYVFSQRSNFIDLNNDGNLDAFVCHDVQPNVYYLNDGTGALEFFQGGLSDVPEGGNYGSIWVDYNNDTFPDLFIAKCKGGGNSGGNLNQLFRNNGDSTFTEVSEEAGLLDPLQTWSSAWGDFDNDGWMDVLVGASSFAQGSHKLMRNNGDGTFADVTEGTGFDILTASGIEWVAYDFDNDGFIDVLGGNGRFMMNNGDMTFTRVEFEDVTNGPIGDLNNDGFLDVANGNKMHLNVGNENNWIKFHTLGTVSNLNGIGARIELYTPAGKQIRDVQSGVGFRYMNTLNVHFGLGEESVIDSIRVLWTSGIVDTYFDLQINTSHLLTENETEEIIDPLSTTNGDRKSIHLHPNPAQDVLNLSPLERPVKGMITIFDIQGRVAMQTPYSDKLDIATLPKGLYILKLNSERYVSEAKFVKM